MRSTEGTKMSEETQVVETEETQAEETTEENTGNEENDILQSDTFKKLLADQVQKESDRKTTSVVKEREALKKELEEVKKAQMDEKQRATYEAEQREKEINEREQRAIRRELELQAVDLLSEEGLPVALRSIVVGKDEEETKANIEIQKKIILQDREEQIKKLGRSPVKGTGDAQKNTMTLADFNSLSPSEKTKAALSGVKVVD